MLSLLNGRSKLASTLGLVAALLVACQTSAPTKPPQDSESALRNARVAIERPAGELTFFAGELSNAELDELARVAPNVRLVAGLSREQALARASEAHGIDARFASQEFLERASNVRWVQAMSAGVDRYMGIEALKDERVVLTNMRGAHGPAIADHSFAMLLTLTRNLRVYADRQARGEWKRGGAEPSATALAGQTMLVVGLGGIGSEVAVRAHGFGMRVIATRRTSGERPSYVERVGKPEELLELLGEADVVAVCVPLTSETERLFDARAFAALKPGAILINIARGKVVDTAALLAALDSGQLGGACLDVTDPEPLPAEHALWRAKNVVITPHVAADAQLTDERSWELLRDNLRRFGAGEPLLNVVDKQAGY
jgi:phosphoglycerate dehydrogenase-like enzyme